MKLDRRLHAYRTDLADARLKGRIDAERFVEGRPMCVRAPLVDLKPRPSKGAGTDTQLLMGQTVRVFDARDGWSWLQSEADGYVGYAQTDALALPGAPPTHIVTAPRTFLYPSPDMKLPPVCAVSLGTTLTVTGSKETRATLYAELAGNRFVLAGHIAPLAETAPDWVAVAERLLHAPYLWGGASAFGLDCSALVQLPMRMAGLDAPRDSDMQAESLGEPIEGDDLQRGDLVFWKGHVGVMLGREIVLHASGHTNLVSAEPLVQAIRRIAYLYGEPTGYRRTLPNAE